MDGDNGPAIVVHGGAWSIPAREYEPHLEGCRVAARAGFDVLERGGSALDAVVEAVAILEDDPTFNAGRGAHLTSTGEVELDAGVMDGDLRMGAVACVRGVLHPIRLARAVMERMEIHLLVGTAAEERAREWGFSTHADLRTARELERWRKLREGAADTVGACARDGRGRLAAATSTGGTMNKPPGRVGDSPLCGSGFYAWNERGCASTTGHGESIMKVALAIRAVELLEHLSPDLAAGEAVSVLDARTGGKGGLILVPRSGQPAWAHNSSAMPVCAISAAGEILRIE